MAEGILASHSGRKQITPGEFVVANIDIAMGHEALGVSGGVADIFRQMGVEKVWNSDRVIALLDHWVPAPSPRVADTHKQCRGFVKEFRITNWLGMSAGISHQVLLERGMVKPGELIVGADSHTTTYDAFGALGRVLTEIP